MEKEVQARTFVTQSFSSLVSLSLWAFAVALLSGCAGEVELDYGTYPVASDFWHYVLWIGCSFLLLAGLGSAADGDGEGLLSKLVVVAVIVGVAWFFFDFGWERPSTRSIAAAEVADEALRREESDRERAQELARQARIQEQQEQERRAAEALTPAGQLQSAQNAIRDLRQHIDEQLEPLVGQYRAEQVEMNAELSAGFAELGVSTHEALLRARDENLEFVLLLERAAINRSLIEWLEARIEEGERTLVQLEHNSWRLERQVEMNSVVDEAEQDAIIELIDTADVIISRGVGPDARQDIGDYERELFREIASEGGRGQ